MNSLPNSSGCRASLKCSHESCNCKTMPKAFGKVKLGAFQTFASIKLITVQKMKACLTAVRDCDATMMPQGYAAGIKKSIVNTAAKIWNAPVKLNLSSYARPKKIKPQWQHNNTK